VRAGLFGRTPARSPERRAAPVSRGYDTQVARGGDNFSSGQAQRIALARALLKDAPILFLDEATSSLDSATEHGIRQALEENRRNRTTILIAHRLSTVVKAGRILVLQDGALVETGTHDELLWRGGRDYELFHWQALDVPLRVAQTPHAVTEALATR
jgi:ATP-binding cassette subfamily B protein